MLFAELFCGFKICIIGEISVNIVGSAPSNVRCAVTFVSPSPGRGLKRMIKVKLRILSF